MDELVVLVDEQNRELGTAPKDSVHTKNTPLHRGFSLFLFNSKGHVLLTKRSKHKKTFPGVWTNTVCGHPGPGESVVEAAKRRLEEELGITIGKTPLRQGYVGRVREVAVYRYRFTDANGIVENEICPVLVDYCDIDPTPDPQEVEKWKWKLWNSFISEIVKNRHVYSPWCHEEAKIINQSVRQKKPGASSLYVRPLWRIISHDTRQRVNTI